MTAARRPGSAEIADLVTAVSAQLRRAMREEMAPHGLAPHHGRALRVLDREGPQRLGELAECLRVAPRSATEVVDALVERGLVERVADPADRRARIVRLTQEGAATAAAVGRARDARAADLFGRLSAAERADLERLLRAVLPPRDL